METETTVLLIGLVAWVAFGVGCVADSIAALLRERRAWVDEHGDSWAAHKRINR